MSNVVRRDGQYSGLPEYGMEWPEVLVGAKEIARFMRLHPDTVKKMLRDGHLPGKKDARRRWVTTRRWIEIWILEATILRRLAIDLRDLRRWAMGQ